MHLTSQLCFSTAIHSNLLAYLIHAKQDDLTSNPLSSVLRADANSTNLTNRSTIHIDDSSCTNWRIVVSSSGQNMGCSLVIRIHLDFCRHLLLVDEHLSSHAVATLHVWLIGCNGSDRNVGDDWCRSIGNISCCVRTHAPRTSTCSTSTDGADGGECTGARDETKKEIVEADNRWTLHEFMHLFGHFVLPLSNHKKTTLRCKAKQARGVESFRRSFRLLMCEDTPAREANATNLLR